MPVNIDSSHDVMEQGPIGSAGENVKSNETLFRDYQKKIQRAEAKKKRFNGWAAAGKKAYRGYDAKEGGDESYDMAMQASQVGNEKIFKYDMNFMRRPIEAQIAKTYARNPKFIAKPVKPIFVDAPPVQQMDPVTGQVFMAPQIDPATGMPVQIDVSENICDVAEALMEDIFRISDFKSELKCCTREAHQSPASIMQIGYQYDDDSGQDTIYFRRRKFDKFLVDPDAEIYEGVVRRCKWMAFEWQLTKDEAEEIGLDWNSIKSKENYGSAGEERACVYNLWDRSSGVVVWVPRDGVSLGKDPEPWPWQISGFPFEILKLTEDIDQQFSKPPIVEALPVQEELQVLREEITANVTNARPMTMYDPSLIDEDKIGSIERRGKYSYIGVDGLSGIPNDPIRRIGDSQLTAETYNHYERCKVELNEMLGTSANEALRATDTTAKEAEIIDRNAGNSTSAKIDTQSDFINACAKKAVQIIRQTYTTEKVTQIVGRDNTKYWVRWIGSQIFKDIEIGIETGSTEREDSAYNRQVSLNMLETMKGVPGIDVTMLALDVLREHGKRNADNYKIEMMPQPQIPGQASAGVGPTSGNDVAAGITGQMSPMV